MEKHTCFDFPHKAIIMVSFCYCKWGEHCGLISFAPTSKLHWNIYISTICVHYLQIYLCSKQDCFASQKGMWICTRKEIMIYLGKPTFSKVNIKTSKSLQNEQPFVGYCYRRYILCTFVEKDRGIVESYQITACQQHKIATRRL